MRKRHTYGATDNIVLDFRVTAGGKEYLQGDEVPHNGKYLLHVNVGGTGAIGRVALIHNESYAYQAPGNGRRDLQFTYTDPHPAGGGESVLCPGGAGGWEPGLEFSYLDIGSVTQTLVCD